MPSLPPFAQQSIQFAAALSTRLLTDSAARPYPELQALGFWIRKAELLKLRDQFATLGGPCCTLVPRGIVLHVPPSNVDTLFVYSWLLAMLTGNRNVVRLSQSETPVATLLCQVVRDLFRLEDYRDIGARTRFVRYGHEVEVTSALSSVADVRVLWGGDRSITALRATPLPPWGKEITFPDRWSLCAINAPVWSGLSDIARTGLAEQFFNDAFWFDQAACSSPRLVVFCGVRELCCAASDEFFARVADVARARGFRWETGTVLQKILFSHQAVLDRHVVRVQTLGNELTVLHLKELAGLERSQPGGGLFFTVQLDNLLDLVPHVDRRDQSLSVFGFPRGSLSSWYWPSMDVASIASSRSARL